MRPSWAWWLSLAAGALCQQPTVNERADERIAVVHLNPGALHKPDRSLRPRRHGRGQWGQGPRARRIGVRNKSRRTWGRGSVRVRHLPGWRRRRRDVGERLARDRERAHLHYFIVAIEKGAICSGRRPNMEQLTHNIWHAYPIHCDITKLTLSTR